MVVLPGSFYIQVACEWIMNFPRAFPARAKRDFPQSCYSLGRRYRHKGPSQRSRRGACGIHVLRSRHPEWNAGTSARQYAARLEIDRNPSNSRGSRSPVFIEAFQAPSDAIIDSEVFYKRLREKRQSIRAALSKCLCDLAGGRSIFGKAFQAAQTSDIEAHYLHPSLLDSMDPVAGAPHHGGGQDLHLAIN